MDDLSSSKHGLLETQCELAVVASDLRAELEKRATHSETERARADRLERMLTQVQEDRDERLALLDEKRQLAEREVQQLRWDFFSNFFQLLPTNRCRIRALSSSNPPHLSIDTRRTTSSDSTLADFYCRLLITTSRSQELSQMQKDRDDLKKELSQMQKSRVQEVKDKDARIQELEAEVQKLNEAHAKDWIELHAATEKQAEVKTSLAAASEKVSLLENEMQEMREAFRDEKDVLLELVEEIRGEQEATSEELRERKMMDDGKDEVFWNCWF